MVQRESRMRRGVCRQRHRSGSGRLDIRCGSGRRSGDRPRNEARLRKARGQDADNAVKYAGKRFKLAPSRRKYLRPVAGTSGVVGKRSHVDDIEDNKSDNDRANAEAEHVADVVARNALPGTRRRYDRLLRGLPIGLFVFRRSRVHDSLKFDCLPGFPACVPEERPGNSRFTPSHLMGHCLHETRHRNEINHGGNGGDR